VEVEGTCFLFAFLKGGDGRGYAARPKNLHLRQENFRRVLVNERP
jgi:hypothetical protein